MLRILLHVSRAAGAGIDGGTVMWMLSEDQALRFRSSLPPFQFCREVWDGPYWPPAQAQLRLMRPAMMFGVIGTKNAVTTMLTGQGFSSSRHQAVGFTGIVFTGSIAPSLSPNAPSESAMVRAAE